MRMQAQELLQQVSAVNPKTAMQDTVTTLAGQQAADEVISQHLQAALALHEGGCRVLDTFGPRVRCSRTMHAN